MYFSEPWMTNVNVKEGKKSFGRIAFTVRRSRRPPGRV